jgi:DNA invertase Pin-like site-specific DNA recombinase
LQVFVYIRFSTPRQEGGDSRERQLLSTKQFCDSHLWTITELIEDLGRSAYKGDHLNGGNLGKFSDRVRAGEIPPGSILVVEQIDRLSREGHGKALHWMNEMMAAGLRIAVVQGGRIFDQESLAESIVDTVEILVRAKLANDESKLKSVRGAGAWQRKMEAAASDHSVLTASCPGWLEVAPTGEGIGGTGFTVLPERAAIVRKIFEWSADGFGLQAVVKRLNDNGLKPWGRSGGGWSPTHIKRLLEAPSPEGDFIPYFSHPAKPNGQRIVGYYPRIVDAALVSSARAALVSRRGTGGRRYGNGAANLFSGLFVCSNCRGKMTVKRGPQRRGEQPTGPPYLGCANAGLHRECDRKQLFRYGDFEVGALKAMLHLALDDRFFVRPDRAAQVSASIAQRNKDLADLNERIDGLIGVLERTQLPQVEAQLLTLAREAAAAEADVKQLIETLDAALGEVSPAEHLQRVIEVQSALQSDDQQVRIEARTKIHGALKGVVDQVVCDAFDSYGDSVPKKTFTLILVGGAEAFKFSNRGQLLGHVSMLDGSHVASKIVFPGDVDCPPSAPMRQIQGSC